MSIYETVKKYLLLLAGFFILATSAHLVIVYLYDGSTLSPEAGGTVNVGIIGSSASLNPTLYGIDSTNDYALRFISRSVLRYNIESHEIEGDLANCNLGRDYAQIRCYVNPGNTWQDGTPVTKEDIIASYGFYKTNEGNRVMQKSLENITVADQGEYIEFSGKADILILDIFLYPIMRSDLVEQVRAGKFSLNAFLSSGPYIFEKKEIDERYGSENISLMRNENYTKTPTYIQRYVLKFFRDKPSLLSAKDSLNIVFPDERIDALPSPRFNEYHYLLPGYLSLFLNADRIGPRLRNIILFQLGNTRFSSLDTKAGKLIRNPFFTDESIAPKSLETKNIEATLSEAGYYKKDTLAAELAKTPDASTKTPDTNTYFTTPTNRKQYATAETDILISGTVPSGVTGVFINNYPLKNFDPKSGRFYYRAKADINTLKEGINTYALAFVSGGVRTNKETLTIFQSGDAATVETKAKEYAAAFEKEKTNNALSNKKLAQEKKILSEKIAELDPLYYYNKKLEKLSIELQYSGELPFAPALTSEIEKSLKTVGIEVKLMPISWESFQKDIIVGGKKSYDMLLTGIDLGLSSYNIFPFFHSGQAEKGFNFSKLKNIELDILLERLKSSQINPESLTNLKQSILGILRKENVILTLYSPYRSFYIDKNLKNVKNTDILPVSSGIYDLSESTYVKEERTIDEKSKWWNDFLLWFQKNTPSFLQFLIP